MASEKILIILRHGQAKNASFNEHDHSRTLTEKGHKEAIEMGETLYDNGFIPDYVLCSTASRTRETLEEIKQFFPTTPEIEYSPKIYNASEVELLLKISYITDSVDRLMIIGHNPGLYQLSLALAKEGDKQMHNRLQMEFPTCALAVIGFDGTWGNILSSRSKLLLFTTPRK